MSSLARELDLLPNTSCSHPVPHGRQLLLDALHEGLHLHMALVVVFVKDNWCWGVPGLITGLYTFVRYHSIDDTYQ
ncbi:hypothetical protein J6590_025642 [Homalodisca vitripennis]|nr:hypothetical protein J6590_025642 [Homalodisca vitripennis]